MTGMMRAIGFMSGTSMDGVDVTLIESDGEKVTHRGEGMLLPYSHDERALINKAVGAARGLTDRTARPEPLGAAERAVTLAHVDAVKRYLDRHGLAAADIDIAGFHGQTLLHRPDVGLTLQIGDGEMLARMSGIDVVYDLRANDMAHGGQGAPLVPVYHRALAKQTGLELPVAVVNIGGVANVTWIGVVSEMLAFDTGPGNAMLDDWVAAHSGKRIDEGGALARQGHADPGVLKQLLSSSYFENKPPKSLDRNDFSLSSLDHLDIADGAATLTAFTVQALGRAIEHMPASPREWIICGGGARNPFMVERLKEHLRAPVRTADELGWSGEFMEAEAFAFLAVRSLKGLPLTWPGTTGVKEPICGGVLARAAKAGKA